MFRIIKDKGFSILIKKLINKKIDFGDMREFEIDSLNHIIKGKILLKGEAEELSYYVSDYKVFEENNSLFFSCERIHTDRKWINILIKKFPYKIKVPQKLIKFKKIIEFLIG